MKTLIKNCSSHSLNCWKCQNGFTEVEMFCLCMFRRHAFGFPLTFLIDCKIDVNNNNPAGLEHCKLMASVVQYVVKEGKICDNVIQYSVFVIIHIYLIGVIAMYLVSYPFCVLCLYELKCLSTSKKCYQP